MTVRTSDFRPLTSDKDSICAICVLLFIGIGAGWPANHGAMSSAINC